MLATQVRHRVPTTITRRNRRQRTAVRRPADEGLGSKQVVVFSRHPLEQAPSAGNIPEAIQVPRLLQLAFVGYHVHYCILRLFEPAFYWVCLFVFLDLCGVFNAATFVGVAQRKLLEVAQQVSS